MNSPYLNKDVQEWLSITEALIAEHPLSKEILIETVLNAWKDILKTRIGTYMIGIDIFPKPQIMGFFLHELVAFSLQKRFPLNWRCERTAKDKDIVCLLNDIYSIEIKTSSSVKNIYGNRSYSKGTRNNKKLKSGYYLAINFEKFTQKNTNPQITKIRFGWLDYEDWQGQRAESGQQSRLSKEVEKYKLITIYAKDKDN